MKIKLLISARDPGAAKCMMPIIRLILCHDIVAPRIVAHSPAFEYFEAEGFPVRHIQCPPLNNIHDPMKAELFQETDHILATESPDAILTGLSSPGVGIDEALTYRGKTPFKYSVQDSEGQVVLGFDRAAPTYFVASTRAAAKTERYPGIETVVVGSLRHACYAKLSPKQLRASGRNLLPPLTAAGMIVGFYGQPAWQWKGYSRTIVQLVTSLRHVMPEALVVYRPHPKESQDERNATLTLFASGGMKVVSDPNPDIETSLCVPDIVVSCFSLCGIDQVYLQRQSNIPLGTVLYLLFEPDIFKTYSDDSGSDVPWHVEDKMAFAVRRLEDLDQLLLRCATTELSVQVWKDIHSRVKPAEDSSGLVINRIIDDVEKGSLH